MGMSNCISVYSNQLYFEESEGEMTGGEVITVAHIEGDFEEALAETGEFYINVDVTPDHVEEFRIKSGGEEESSVGKDTQFCKANDGTYEAALSGQNFKFQVPIKNFDGNALGDFDLQSGDATDSYVALGDSNGSICVYNREWERVLDLQEAHQSDVTVTKFFPSGEVILSGSSDMQLKVWSVADGSNPRTLRGHAGTINDVIMIGRGRNILSSSMDGSVRLWEIGSGETIYTYYRDGDKLDPALCMTLLTLEENVESCSSGLHPLEFGTQGKQILVGHESGTMALHDLASKQQLVQFPNTFMSPCTSVLRITNNLVLSGYENGVIALWDVRKPNEYIHKLSIINNYSVNKLYLDKNKIYVSCGIDTAFSIVISGKKLLPSTVTFLVNDDSTVTHFINIGFKEHEKLLVLGKRGYCSLYEV